MRLEFRGTRPIFAIAVSVALLCGCKQGNGTDDAPSATASDSSSAAPMGSSVGITPEVLASEDLTAADFYPGRAPALIPSPAPDKKVPGPEDWGETFLEVAGTPPYRPVPKRREVPKPWPECATTLGRQVSEEKQKVPWTARKTWVAERYKRADALAQRLWAPLQRKYFTARQVLVDALASGCELDKPAAGCKAYVDRLRASGAAGGFECRGWYAMRATNTPARDLLLCEADGRWTLVEIPDETRSAMLGAELAATVERDGLASALGVRALAPETDTLFLVGMVPAKIRISEPAKLTPYFQRLGDVSGGLGRLMAAGFESPLVAQLWSDGNVWLVSPKRDGAPSVVLEQRGHEVVLERKAAPPRAPSSYEGDVSDGAIRCDNPALWENAACMARDEGGSLRSWFKVAGKPGVPQIAWFPEQPAQAIGTNGPPTVSARVLAFQRAVESKGGFAPFECTVVDVSLETNEEELFDERSRTLARRAGVAPGSLTEWQITCTTGNDASGGLVVVHVPSHDLWADAAIGPGGYSVSAYHAVKSGHFSGELRELADAGLAEVPIGAKLSIAGYTELRLRGPGSWHVGFRSNCAENGLPCAFRDGRGEPAIKSVELKKCDIAGFVYPK